MLVAFSHLRWGFVWQRPQHLLTRFAREMPVLVVEEPEYHLQGADVRVRHDHGVTVGLAISFAGLGAALAFAWLRAPPETAPPAEAPAVVVTPDAPPPFVEPMMPVVPGVFDRLTAQPGGLDAVTGCARFRRLAL